MHAELEEVRQHHVIPAKLLLRRTRTEVGSDLIKHHVNAHVSTVY